MPPKPKPEPKRLNNLNFSDEQISRFRKRLLDILIDEFNSQPSQPEVLEVAYKNKYGEDPPFTLCAYRADGKRLYVAMTAMCIPNPRKSDRLNSWVEAKAAMSLAIAFRRKQRGQRGLPPLPPIAPSPYTLFEDVSKKAQDDVIDVFTFPAYTLLKLTSNIFTR